MPASEQKNTTNQRKYASFLLNDLPGCVKSLKITVSRDNITLGGSSPFYFAICRSRIFTVGHLVQRTSCQIKGGLRSEGLRAVDKWSRK